MQGWMNDEYEPALAQWEVWCDAKKKKKKEESPKDWTEEGAGMLHNITKPRQWRGGTQVIEDVFEDAQPMETVEVKRQEWRVR